MNTSLLIAVVGRGWLHAACAPAHQRMLPYIMIGLLAQVAYGGAESARRHKPPCAPTDDKGDCAALVALAKSTQIEGWEKKTHWLEDKTVCSWYGVTCKGGRVVGLSLKSNNLRGSLPSTLGSLSELRTLALNGKRPPGYGPHSCLPSGATNFNGSSLPPSFYALSKLQLWSMEYTCLGGTLAPALGSMGQLSQIWVRPCS